MTKKRKQIHKDDAKEWEERRQFLLRCGRFAVITPPAMTLLLEVAAKPSDAFASGIRRRPVVGIIRSLLG